MKVITVFGSSVPQPGSEPFEAARRAGRLLAEAGYAVASGGYSGTMTAVSQGAAEAGGHVIGVTCDQIERYRLLPPNRWIKEEIRYPTLRERLLHLVSENVGMITLPGGIGTLSEMALAWSFLQVGVIEQRPFAMVGEMWPNTIHTFYEPLYIEQMYMDMLYFAESVDTAVAHIINYHP